MNADQKEILRDDIALIVKRHWPEIYTVHARDAANEIVTLLCAGGAYHITAEGLDYLAAHRRALVGLTNDDAVACSFEGHRLRLGDANGQNPDEYINCSRCGMIVKRGVLGKPFYPRDECGHHDWTSDAGKAACRKCGKPMEHA